MKTKETKHPAVVKMFQQLGVEMSEHHQMENGVYNSADPTAYSKGKMDFTYNGRTKYCLKYFDCTWGIEFTVYLYQPHEAWDGNNNDTFLKYFHKKTIGGFYLTQDEKIPRVVYRDNEPGLLLFLYRYFRNELNLRPDQDTRVYSSEFEDSEYVWTDWREIIALQMYEKAKSLGLSDENARGASVYAHLMPEAEVIAYWQKVVRLFQDSTEKCPESLETEKESKPRKVIERKPCRHTNSIKGANGRYCLDCDRYV